MSAQRFFASSASDTESDFESDEESFSSQQS